ncbi:MAG: YggT family protein [Gemmatimonadales bacterium]|nr:YggT family protein [Gemmatimonadales bacterium]
MILNTIELVARVAVVISLIFASVVALTHWAVRSRRLTPFGMWARAVRRISDPVVGTVERRVIRSGGNPQDAPLWLVGVVVAAGLVILSLLHWIIGVVGTMHYLVYAGPRAWLRVLVAGVFGLLMVALFVRVISSWIGLSLYSRVLRPVVLLTEWLLEPIRRRLPPFGMFDLSPMVAYLLLWIVRGVMLGAL